MHQLWVRLFQDDVEVGIKKNHIPYLTFSPAPDGITRLCMCYLEMKLRHI